MSTQPRHVIGCMTGTSLDGLDVALVRIHGNGLHLQATLLADLHWPLQDLAATLRRFALGQAHPPVAYALAARELGICHARAIATLLQRCDEPIQPDFVVAHGQTIWHQPPTKTSPPQQPSTPGVSWQLFDPWPIVQRCRLPVCHDLRQADLVAGGQGAPITPLADWILYRHHAQCVINLGGICNITHWQENDNQGSTIAGGDITVCNMLLDGLIQRLVPGRAYDDAGKLAATGKPNQPLIRAMTQLISTAQANQQSLGREQFDRLFIDKMLEAAGRTAAPDQAGTGSLGPADVLASAIEAIVNHIDPAVQNIPGRGIILAGGGVRNNTLFHAMKLRDAEQHLWQLSDEVGIPCQTREAVCFAILGALSADGIPITLPRITHATNPGIAGSWSGQSRI